MLRTSSSARRALSRPMCSAALWSNASIRLRTPSQSDPKSRTSAASDERKAPSRRPMSAVAAAVAAAAAPSTEARSSATSLLRALSRCANGDSAIRRSRAGLKPAPPLSSSSQSRSPPMSSPRTSSRARRASSRQRERMLDASRPAMGFSLKRPLGLMDRGEITGPAPASPAHIGMWTTVFASSCSIRSRKHLSSSTSGCFSAEILIVRASFVNHALSSSKKVAAWRR